jgi:hypothetical protein
MKNLNQEINIVQSDKEDLVKEDIVKGSLIEDYHKYVDYLERQEWTRETITITELLYRIVTINNLNAGNNGIVLDIRCPAGQTISIPGIKGLSNVDIEKILPFEIKLADSNGREIDPDTCIKILKHKLLKMDKEIGQVSYRDISMVDYSDSPNLFKDYKDLYRFEKGIELKGEESLRLYIVDPDIDINIVKFNFGLDLWTN